MRTRTKRVSGDLLDIESQETVCQVKVKITLGASDAMSRQPDIEVEVTADGYRPDLASRRFMLRLNQDLTGEVFVGGIADKYPDHISTTFPLFFQDPIWNDPGWFESL